MASHETMSALFASAPSLVSDAANREDDDCFQDLEDHCFGDYYPMSPNSHDLSSSHSSDVEDEEDDVDDSGVDTPSTLRARVSGLSIDDEMGSDNHSSSFPVTAGGSGMRRRRRAGSSSLSGRLVSRDRWVDKAWETRSGSASPEGADPGSGCRLLLRPRGGRSMSGRIRMDMEEVQACRDLGLELPGDCMVEICGSPTACVASAGSSGPCSAGSSPRGGGGGGSWICSPGDDPREIKARLKQWAHAVALASASRLSC